MLLVFEEIEWFQLLKIVQKRDSSKPAAVSESEQNQQILMNTFILIARRNANGIIYMVYLILKFITLNTSKYFK